jgi:putative ABC transport system ATP-binding protein
MIELINVSKTFSQGTPAEVNALQSVSLKIEKGDFVILAGSNGSGKTTLLNLISGSLFADSGKIFFCGKEITQMPEYRRAAFISRIFQNPMAGTCAQLTIAENFRLAALRTHKRKIRIGLTRPFKADLAHRIAFLQLGLENKLNTMMGKLSGGQRQALTLLMAAMSGASLMLLDEPAAALDPRTGSLVMQLAETIIRQNHLTAILVTHHIKDILQFGNRLIFLRQGRILHNLSAQEKQKLSVSDIVSWFEN